LRPLEESVARVRAITRAAEAEGVEFQLNARTDALFLGDKTPEGRIQDAVTRGRAYLDEGAALVFVPGAVTRDVVERLVEGVGWGKVSVIGLPGALPAEEYEKLGVARISYGPLPQRAALLALRDLAVDLYADGVIPADLPALN
jgi:2-methylisocitrate lyase-like PEP mutase family enzyme